MARIMGSRPTNQWERWVLDRLCEQVPGDWVLVTGVAWTLRTSSGYVRDGEADIVVLAPGRGMAIVEVKGSRGFRVNDSGRWERREGDSWVVVDPSPSSQASSNMYKLRDAINASCKWSTFPGKYAYVVVYPNGEANALPPMLDASTLVTRRDMANLAQRIAASLDARDGLETGQRFDSATMDRVANTLVNGLFKVAPVDTLEEAGGDQDSIEQLTRQQFAALRGIFDLPSVAVRGPAGSGKTLLAIWRLKAFAEEGRRALYICFNRHLADWLRKRHPSLADCIHSIDRFFRGLPGMDRIPIPLGGDQRFFRETLPDLACDYASALGEQDKFDAIVVDEGQDFNESQELALREFLRRDRGSWIYFLDERQNLFQREKGRASTAEVTFNLHHNCRNTALVNEATNGYCDQQVESIPGIAPGVTPLIESPGGEQAIAMRAWSLCKEWASLGSVAVLSPSRLENSSMAKYRNAHRMNLTEDIGELGKPNSIVFSTIKAFKGIEASAIVVVDAPKPGEALAFEMEDLYVACTRPTARLAILCLSQAAESWFRDRGA